MSENVKKTLDSKLLMIIILPIAGLFLIYFMFFFQKTDKVNSGAYDERGSALLIPDSKSDSAEKLKSQAYDSLKEEKRAESQKSSSVSEADFFGLVDIDADKNTSSAQNDEKQPEKKTDPNLKEKVRVVYLNNNASSNEKNRLAKQTEEISAKQTATSEYDGGSMGIYQSKQTFSNSTSDNTQTPTNKEYFPAYFEADTKIKANSSVVLILSKDANIEGKLYKKNSTLFGKVSDGGDYFDLKIHNIRGVDGKNTHVALVVYNENYSRGIINEGKVDKALKESGNETANQASSDVQSSISHTATEEGIRLAAQGVNNTINALTRSRQPEVNLYQGYKVYIKSE